ncbi:helix-turn-helix domain-containing protein [Leptospira sp. GIMC2001]|uniref:helix-turn-helix domain-containing protein n=1 Tax=Leptospira sp. GIMC2001 TaxID=1513297 RepID=UPI00234BA76C|nr:AraC family transcriptional regulator [Leptospira sp. GIMC2001]WCL50319.1 AraC family transcriptional regulator [Leptospira sp. GIMC2001]
MYDPIKDGINKKENSVEYNELKPSADLVGMVHSFWELKTNTILENDFVLHVIPDACVNILLNLVDTRIAAVTSRLTTYVALNLGKRFHYVGIQLLPGMWIGNRDEIVQGFVDSPYEGSLPLVDTANKLVGKKFSEFGLVLSELVQSLVVNKLVGENIITSRILSDIDVIDSVEDMAASANLSTRQLQRILKQTTGFTPHDFLKILRLQLSFRGQYLDYFSDQSHFIHSFRKITGYTPADYFKNFHV